jgi:hypothetical protein
MPAAEIAAAVTGIRSVLEITKAMINLRDEEAFRNKSIELQGVVLETLEKAIEAREEQSDQLERIRALEAEVASLKNWDAEKQKRAQEIRGRFRVLHAEKRTSWLRTTALALPKLFFQRTEVVPRCEWSPKRPRLDLQVQ